MRIKISNGRELTVAPLLVLDVDASGLFENESVDWKYCVERASFQHSEACEFLLHVPADEESLEEQLREMIAYDECSEDLVDVFRAAWECRAAWILLHS